MESKVKKILAIDDNQDNLTIVKVLVLESFPDVLVLTAQNGQDGLALAELEIPDVILLDVVMPKMDGFEVCDHLKSNPRTKDIPVVFVTAVKDDAKTRIRALECGAEAFLSKPIDESELTAQIRVMLKIRAAILEKQNENIRLATLVDKKTRELTDSNTKTLQLLNKGLFGL